MGSSSSQLQAPRARNWTSVVDARARRQRLQGFFFFKEDGGRERDEQIRFFFLSSSSLSLSLTFRIEYFLPIPQARLLQARAAELAPAEPVRERAREERRVHFFKWLEKTYLNRIGQCFLCLLPSSATLSSSTRLRATHQEGAS